MRLLIALVICCKISNSFSQDNGYTDLRTARESFSHVYDKQIKAEISSFTIAGIAESLNKPVLTRWPAVKSSEDSIEFDSSNVKVTIKSGVFFPTKHKLGYDGKYLVKIDNKPYYGNYSKMPQVRIASVVVIHGKDTINLPPAAIGDLYNPHFSFRDGSGMIKSQDAVYLSSDKRNIYVYMLNKDDLGSYEVTWIVEDNKYLRRVIDFGFTK